MRRGILFTAVYCGAFLAAGGGAYALQPPVVTGEFISEVTPEARYYVNDGHVQFAGSPHTTTSTMTMAGGYYFVTFYDKDFHVCLARKHVFALPEWPWTIITFDSLVPPSGNPADEDNHDEPTVAISPNDGRIHLAYGHHTDPLRYRISSAGAATVADGSFTTTLFGAEQNYLTAGTPITSVTYPRFVVEQNSKQLHLFWRRGINYTHMATYQDNGTWAPNIQLNDGRAGAYVDPTGQFPNCSNRRPYITPPAAFGDTIHLHWAWREQCNGTSLAHGLHFATTNDNGATWKNGVGITLGLPMTLSSPTLGWTTPALDFSWRQINGGSTAVDSQGNTHVVVRHDDDGADPNTQRNWHYVRTGTTWTRTMIPFPAAFDSGIAIDRTYDTVYVTTRFNNRAAVYAAQKVTDLGGGSYSPDWDTWNQIYLSAQGYTFDPKPHLGGAGNLNMLVQRPNGVDNSWSSLRLIKVNIDPNP